MKLEANLLLNDLYDSAGLSFYIRGTDGADEVHSLRPLRLGGTGDLKLIKDPDIKISDGNTYNRLDNFVRLNWGPNNTTIYIVDHHQFALYGWAEAFVEGKVEAGASLRHYDDHNDAGIAHRLEVMTKQVFQERKWDLRQIVEYVRTLGCWEFIEPAQRMGLVNEFIHIAPGHEPTIQNRQADPPKTTNYTRVSTKYYRNSFPRVSDPKRKIVDIDLDYFASVDLTVRDVKQDIKTMQEDIASAGVTTFATSPGFIKQEKAVDLVKRILDLV